MMNKANYHGFTLLEILIALCILSMIISLSSPSFTNYLWKTKIKGTSLTMMANAQFLERWKSSHGTYTDISGNCPVFPYPLYPDSKNDAAYAIDSQKSKCSVKHYIIRALPVCHKARLENGNYQCLCLSSGDSINEFANFKCINNKGICDCIHLK
ncbi:MAG: type IV pilin protein [Burkholderiales bacterium]|nr:type IV pilin protein [Burkholderiales bacterium]